jgi:hypothetical protein
MTNLPELHPLGRGKVYYDELRRLAVEDGIAITADVDRMKQQNGGALTIKDACTLALRYRLRLAALFSILEDFCLVPCGVYDSLKERGLKPMAMLTEVWEEVSCTT